MVLEKRENCGAYTLCPAVSLGYSHILLLRGLPLLQLQVYNYAKQQTNSVICFEILGKLSEVESARTHFEVLGLGLEALGPRKFPCPRLEDSTIF